MKSGIREHPNFQCSVCGTDTKFYHLDAKICSACASFYRRAVREGLKYKCESNDKCKTGKGRYACRACRFARCAELGAHLPTTVSSIPPHTINVPVLKKTTTKKMYPILDKLLVGYDLFLEAQRSIISITHPEIRFSTDKIITNKKIEKREFQTKCVPLLMDMFNTHYGPFKDLKKAQKKQVLIEVSYDFEMFSATYLTSIFFPNLNDTRIMDTCCTYIDLNPIFTEWYCEGFIEPDKLKAYINAIDYPMRKMLKLLARFKKLGLSKADTVALMFLCLYKRIDQNNWLSPEMIEYKDKMVSEWTSILCRKYGEKEGPQKLTTMMHMYYEFDIIANQLSKYVLVQQVSLNKQDDEMMCGISEYMNKLDLGEGAD